MTDTASGPRVGVIGLGNMGSALADTLIVAGFDVTVWNRTAARTRRFAEAGIAVAATPAELSQVSDIVVVCLFDHAANLDVVLTDEVAVHMRGKVLLQLGHVGADKIGEHDAWARRHDVGLLSGWILVYPDDIRARDGAVAYGGPRAIYDRAQSLLQAMGGRPVWAGERLDSIFAFGAAYCCFLFPAVVGFLNAAAVCQSAGISITDFTDAIITPLIRGPVLTGMIQSFAQATASRSYGGDLQATLDAWNHGLHVAINGIERSGADASLMHAVARHLDQASANGHGQEDLASAFEVMIAEREKHD